MFYFLFSFYLFPINYFYKCIAQPAFVMFIMFVSYKIQSYIKTYCNEQIFFVLVNYSNPLSFIAMCLTFPHVTQRLREV